MRNFLKNRQIMMKILLGIIVILSGILLGSPVRNNVQIVYVLIDILAIIFIIKKGLKKEKIINGKLDIAVLILCLSSCIPIIFGAYASLNDSILFVLKYISIFWVYLITKDLVKNSKNTANYLIYVILVVSVILVALGIDRLTYHYFKPALEVLGITNLYQGEIRLTSLFSYPNSFGAMAGCGIFLALGQSLKSQRKVVKGINYAISFALFAGVILSLSRLMYLVMVVVAVLYFFLCKGKEKKIEVLEMLVITGILGVIYSARFMNLLTAGDFARIWIDFGILTLVAFIIGLFVKIVNGPILKMQKRNFIKTSVVSCLGVIAVLVILATTPENLVLFNNENSMEEVERHLSNIKGEEKYVLKFEIDAKGAANNFQIVAQERDEFWNNLNSSNIHFGDFQGNKEIEIYTQKDTKDIYLQFRATETSEDTKLEITSFEVNGKKVNLSYKFIPYDFVSKMENMNLGTQSAVDRGTYIKDAFKIIKDNWLFGIGGDGWKERYADVQEYGYVSREVHSYPTQILLEFGIVGFAAYVVIIVLVLKKTYFVIKQERDLHYISILCAFATLGIHSLVDFDLSFFYLLLIAVMFLGMLDAFNCKTETLEKKNWPIKCVCIGISIFLICVNINCVIAQTMVARKIDVRTSFEDKYEIYEKCNRLLPYNRDYKEKMLKLIEAYEFKYPERAIEFARKKLEYAEYLLKYEKYHSQSEMQRRIVFNSIELLGEEESEQMMENIQNGYELIKNNELKQRNYLNYSTTRRAKINEIAEKLITKSAEIIDENQKTQLKELAKNFYSLHIEEYEKNREFVEKYAGDEFFSKEELLEILKNYKEEASKKIEEM